MATTTNKQIIKAQTKGFKKAKRDIKGTSKSLKGMAKAAIGVGAAMWGAKKLIDGMKAVIALAAEQQLAEKKLQAALGKTSKSLLNYAKELQKVTRYGDEVTLTAMTMIASFVKDEEAIKLATKATMDLAAAKGFDLVTAADLVSKTLGSTTNALTRYGIVVEGAVGSTERLNSMTENIAAVFGGQAQAQANTYTGKIDQMKNAIGDLGEAIGESLLPFLADMAESITGVVEDLTGMVGSMNAALEFEREGERIIAFRLLTDAIKENWENENLRKVMLKELKKEYPDYLGNLRNEEITLENINLLQEEGIKLFKMQQMEKLLTSYTEESMKKIVDGYVMIMEAETDQYALHKKLVYLSRGIFYDVPKTLGEAKIKEGTEEWEEYMKMLTGIKQIIKGMWADSDLFDDPDLTTGEKAMFRVMDSFSILEKKVSESDKLSAELAQINKDFLEAVHRDSGAELPESFSEEYNATVAYYNELIKLAEEKEEELRSGKLTSTYDKINETRTALEIERDNLLEHFNLIEELTEEEKAKIADIEEYYDDKIAKSRKESLQAMVGDMVANFSIMGSQFKAFQGLAKAVAIAQTTYDTYEAAQSQFNAWSESKLPPQISIPLAYAAATLAVGAGLARVDQIRKAQTGADYITDSPEMLMVGEAGRERVTVTPLEDVGYEGGGQGITLNISGNVLTDSFVEDSIVPSLREALRQGESLA